MIESFSPELTAFLEEIEQLGFSLCLVGGATRDYLLSKHLGHDLDFEIRSSAENADWPSYYKKLHQFLSDKKIVYDELPYLITRAHFGDFRLEFSSPRIEKSKSGDLTHHHFDAILDSSLSYKISFQRRDFTLNAIGLEINFQQKTEKWIDPYLGIDDLNAGLLKNINEDFFLDSVRFLRLVRFHLKFNTFSIDPNLLSKIQKFNLTKLSIHHFRKELFKSIPSDFLNAFSELVKNNQLILPSEFNVWTKYTFPKNVMTREELLAFVFLQNPAEAQNVATFFSMPEKKLKDLKSFNQSYQNIKLTTLNQFVNLIQLPEADALQSPILEDLKNLEEKKEWRSFLHTDKNGKELLIDWDDWEQEHVTVEEMHKVATPLRSYYQYYKTLKKKFSNA